MRRAVVTGGAGFVGKAIVAMLAARGVAVTVVGRTPSLAVEALGARMERADIRDAARLVEIFRDHDTVFHVAAKAGIWGKRRDYLSVNVQGTENVLAACRANAVPRLVYTSTPSVVFNGADLAGADESAPYAERFLCHYAETKTMAEKMVLGANGNVLRTCAIRPHLVWGPEDTNLIPRLLAKGRSGRLRQVGAGSNMVDISYIDNVAHAHLLAADSLSGDAAAAGRAYFISQGEPVNLWQWINNLFQRLSIARIEKRISAGAAYFAGLCCEKLYSVLGREEEPPMTRFLAQQLAHSHWFSIARAEKELGYRPVVTHDEGLRRLIAWLATDGGP